jgi:uncharacterized membrane protein YhiD involved in acid resistance
MLQPPHQLHRRAALRAACFAAFLCLAFVGPHSAVAGSQPPSVTQPPQSFPPADAASSLPMLGELKDAFVRLPLAALLGSILALRPRRRAQGRRSVLVVQTQIMLAVVGAVIMLVVGDSVSRAFGIVGAAGLVRYRSTIDDPKEAVVMLCALAAGLAAGVGHFPLAAFATFFMTAVLFVVEYFEPTARKHFELSISTKGAKDFRPMIEGVLKGFALEYELLTEADEEVSYSISAPIEVRTRDISDMLRVLHNDNEEMTIEWDEKKAKK